MLPIRHEKKLIRAPGCGPKTGDNVGARSAEQSRSKMTTAAARLPAQNTTAEDALLRSIRIPPRPSLLVDLQRELAQNDPSPRTIARIIGNDVGMSGALLKLANSPFYGAARKATSNRWSDSGEGGMRDTAEEEGQGARWSWCAPRRAGRTRRAGQARAGPLSSHSGPPARRPAGPPCSRFLCIRPVGLARRIRSLSP